MGELTNFGGIVSSTKNEFGCTVVSRADVRNIGLVLHQDLRAAKVTEFQDARSGVQQQILRLNVSVADSLGVDIGERAKELVDVKLDLEDWHGGLELVEVPRGSVDSLGHEFEHQVEIDLIFLRGDQSCLYPHFVIGIANPVSVGVVECLEFDNVGMADNAHDLQFSVLCIGERRWSSREAARAISMLTLKRLSCSTRLMAASSPDGDNFVWNTTPKLPLPTILHCVYCISRTSPVKPSCTFSRITSAHAVSGSSRTEGHVSGSIIPPILRL